MAKRQHREHQRVILPNGMWINLYTDGTIKIGGYDRTIAVEEVLNRDGGAHVFLHVRDNVEQPRTTQDREADLVTVPRPVRDALSRFPAVLHESTDAR